MELHERIRSLRIDKDMTQRYISQKLGVSENSVRCWENGSKVPSTTAIKSLAVLFNVSTDFLLGVTCDANIPLLLSKQEKTLLSSYRLLDKHGKQVVDAICALERERLETKAIRPKPDVAKFLEESPSRYIPRYSLPSAAGSSEPSDNDDFELIPVEDGVPASADFAVWIQGNSMYPYIHDGDTVYVQRDCELSIGDVGIFCVDGAMYCKQYYLDDERNLTLVSANPKLKHTNVHVCADSGSDVRCYGKVLLGFRIDLPDYMFD